MNAARDILRQKAAQQTDNSEIQLALLTFDKLITSPDEDATRTAVALLTKLERTGFWGEDSAERDILDALKIESGSSSEERFTLVAPPPANQRTSPVARIVLLTDSGHELVLTPEAREELNRVAFLHILATAPERLVPPGKTLRAALTGATDVFKSLTQGATGTSMPTLHEKVEEIVHRAFWDEARESLSSGEPPRQLARLTRLYADLHNALRNASLLPPMHPIMTVLGSPLSPTPAPLLSARNHLIEVAIALRERCAPVRDEALDSIISILEDPETTSQGNVNDLPSRIVNAFKELVLVIEVMKEDLSSAVLSRINDEDLSTEIAKAAHDSERQAVISLCGLPIVTERWRTWVEGARTNTTLESQEGQDVRWMRLLVQALGADVAVSCPLPVAGASSRTLPSASNTTSIQSDEITDSVPRNPLPPPFLFIIPELLHLQNHLQALVIAAVLRTLVPLQRNNSSAVAASSTVTSSADNRSIPDTTSDTLHGIGRFPFCERVLALLMTEVDEDSSDAGTTKLAHLADEVVAEHRRLVSISLTSPSEQPESITSQSQSQHKPPTVDDTTLRARVDALLRPSNAVFVLLRLRLLRALADTLVAVSDAAKRHEATQRSVRVPKVMQTGRERKRMRPDPSLALSTSSSSLRDGTTIKSIPERKYGAMRRVVDAECENHLASNDSPVMNALRRLKGYDDPALQQGVRDALAEMADVVDWVRETWGQVLGLGSAAVE